METNRQESAHTLTRPLKTSHTGAYGQEPATDPGQPPARLISHLHADTHDHASHAASSQDVMNERRERLLHAAEVHRIRQLLR